jgi:hypothetical protein
MGQDNKEIFFLRHPARVAVMLTQRVVGKDVSRG